MDANPFLTLSFVSSAPNRALCFSTVFLRGCDAGAEMPRLLRSRSWTKSRARWGDSYANDALVSQYISDIIKDFSHVLCRSYCKSCDFSITSVRIELHFEASLTKA